MDDKTIWNYNNWYFNKDMNNVEEYKNNFFDAQTAKEWSIHVQSGQLKNELEYIYKEINNSINKGERECTFSNKNFSSQAENFLKDKGFKVSHFYGDQRDPANDTTISW